MFVVKSKVELDAEKKLWFKSEMTCRQFTAIAQKLNSADLENEILNLEYFKDKLIPAKKIDLAEVEKWLKNAWNTENTLALNENIIDKSQSFAIQWAFPQAYYSTFATLLSHYKAVGYTENSHTAVLKKFGSLIINKRLPESLCFHADGAKKRLTYKFISKPTALQSIDLDLTKPETIDNQVCQFLKSTREIKLSDKAPEFIKSMKLKTKSGSYKKRLSPTEWQKVSENIGITTVMDLLYRKRIKANYLDTEIFTYEGFKGPEILTTLRQIVNRINLVNETYVAKAITEKEYTKIKKSFTDRVASEILEKRFETILSIINMKAT